MANYLDENDRKDLYRKMLADNATSESTKKYSFKQFETKILGDDKLLNKLSNLAVKRDWAIDQEDFFYKYAPEKIAKPQPQVQAAPAMQMAAPMEEEEAYTPPPQPLVGTPEYDAQLQAQYGGMSPTLGATFGGVPASFETKEQKKQEQISPVFKAQQLAFEDVPIAEEQRKAQRQFAKAEKQQQQAALRGGAGFELQQEKRRKERGYGEAAADFTGTIAAGGKRIGEGIVSTLQNYVNATLRGGLIEMPATESVENIANYELYKNATNAKNTLPKEAANKHTPPSNIHAQEKGEYGKIPEATIYTIADAAMQIIPAILTMGGSTYFQTLPEAYKNGVDAIAKEKGMSPEQVVASGEDAKIVAEINAGVQSGLEFVGANLVSSSIASRGGYKVMRDWLLGQGVNRNLARGASLLGVGIGEGVTEYLQEGTGQIGTTAAKSPTTKAFLDKLPKELFSPEAKKQRKEAFVGGLIGGLGVGGGGQAVQSAMDRTLFEAPKIGKASQRADMDIVQTDNKIQERNKIAQAMEEAVKGNPEAEGQIRAQYQKRVNEAAPTDEEVLNAYEGLAALPETEEKNTIRENLEAYMAEKGIQPEAVGMDAGLGEGMRVTAPSEETMPPAPPIEPVAPEVTPTETAPLEEAPVEEAIQEDEDLASLGQTISGLEQAPVEEAAPEQVVPAEEETPVEEVAPQPKAGDFVIVNGEKGVVVVTPGGQMSVETDTKIYDLDERGIAGIGGRLVAPKEQTQTEYEVEVIDDDNAIVNGESFKIIRDEKGNTIALQGETRNIRTEPVMVDVDIKRNKAQVKETLQEQSAEVETLSPDMTLDKQGFVDDIIGQNMTEGVDRILSEGVTDKTAERDLLQFKLFVEATIADLRARQKGNPYAEAMIEQLQEALNTVYYEYYSQGRKAEARTSKPQKAANRGVKGKERVSPKPAEGKQLAAPAVPAPKAEPAKTNEEQIADLRAEEQAKGEDINTLSENQLFSLGFTRKESKAIAMGEKKVALNNITIKGIDLARLATAFGKSKEELQKFLAKNGIDEVDFNEQWEKQNSDDDPKYIIIVIGEYNTGDPDQLGKFYTEAAAKRAFEKADERQEGSEDQDNIIDLISQGDEGDFISINSKSIPAINDATREILYDVQREFGGKYTNIELPNGKILNLRIADHSANRKNNTGDRNLSVVISNLNPTKRFRGQIDKMHPNEIIVNSELSVEQIIEQINEAIGEINEQEGGKPTTKAAPVTPAPVKTNEQQIADLRAKEQAELDSKIKDANKYRGKDGKVDRSKLTNKADIKTFDEVYAKYDKLISPLMTEQPAAPKAEFTSQQESSASQEFDGMKKPSKIKTKSFDGKHGKGAFERMKNITDNFEDIMDGMSGKIKQDCL